MSRIKNVYRFRKMRPTTGLYSEPLRPSKHPQNKVHQTGFDVNFRWCKTSYFDSEHRPNYLHKNQMAWKIGENNLRKLLFS
jgi:hypothetical protein